MLFIAVKKQLSKKKVDFTGDSLVQDKRFFRYFTLDEIKEFTSQAGFKILETKEKDSQSRPGEVVWIYVFARKLT